jgi:hypothetical protein
MRGSCSRGLFKRLSGLRSPLSLLVAVLALISPVIARSLPSTLQLPYQGACNGFYIDDFNNPAGLIPASQWNGNPDSSWWIDEFDSRSRIENGVLKLNLRRYWPAQRGKEAAVTFSQYMATRTTSCVHGI